MYTYIFFFLLDHSFQRPPPPPAYKIYKQKGSRFRISREISFEQKNKIHHTGNVKIILHYVIINEKVTRAGTGRWAIA